MKKLTTIILIFVATISSIFAQTPNSFKYQTVVRDAASYIIADHNVGFKISIIQNDASGTTIYTETHAVTTNEFGLVNLNIGEGTTTDNFSSIDWSNGPYFIKVALDETGGENYVEMGTSQLLSVPFAMYANDVANKDDDDADASNELINSATLNGTSLEITDAGGTKIVDLSSLDQSNMNVDDNDPDPNNEIQTIDKTGNTVTLSNGGGSFTDEVDDNDPDPNNEIQTIDKTGNTVTLSNGGGSFTDEVDDNDPDPNNEIQTIDKTGNTVTLSNGGGSFTDEVDDADHSTTNEIQTINKTGSTVTLSNGGGSFTDEVNDADHSTTNEIQTLSLSNNNLSLTNGGSVSLGQYSDVWSKNGSNIFYNNGWVGVGTSTPSGKMVVQGDASVDPDSALFEVKNKNGQTIFAVYDGGVRIWVDDTDSKINTDKGGFAVGGYRLNKTISNEYLRVTPDSVRIWIDDTPPTGSKINTDKGGFAVGGYRLNKTTSNEYMRISPDSVRVYIEENDGDNSGFAVRGFDAAGSETADYLNITNDSSRVYVEGDGGFAVGNIESGSSEEYMDITPLNSFIGFHSGLNTIPAGSNGKYNTYIGQDAGKLSTVGAHNIFIGHNAGSESAGLTNSYNVFIGYEAGKKTTGGDNVFIGNQSGLNNKGGNNNVFLGVSAGEDNTTGYYNFFLGNKAGQSNTTGYDNVCIAQTAGYGITEGYNNLCIGKLSGYNVGKGNNNILIGYKAGFRVNNGRSNQLYIENSNVDSTKALIWGNFALDKLRFNAKVGIGRFAGASNSNTLEVEGKASKTTAGSWLANSDRRIKKDIESITNAYELVLKLRPVTFKYTDEWKQKHPVIEDKVYYNFIAQEYREVFPKSVKGSGEYLDNDDEEIIQIDTYNAQIVAIQAVQDLIKENKKQQELIDELKAEIETAKLENQQIKNDYKSLKAEIEEIKSFVGAKAEK